MAIERLNPLEFGADWVSSSPIAQLAARRLNPLEFGADWVSATDATTKAEGLNPLEFGADWVSGSELQPTRPGVLIPSNSGLTGFPAAAVAAAVVDPS